MFKIERVVITFGSLEIGEEFTIDNPFSAGYGWIWEKIGTSTAERSGGEHHWYMGKEYRFHSGMEVTPY